MSTRFATCCAFACALLAGSAAAADAERGRGLYEQRCTACHAQSVHSRAHRVAADYGEVRGWVQRWNDTLGLAWQSEDIDDVTAFLNETYYRYPVPGPREAGPVETKVAAAPSQKRP